jgi:hypothetical protein
VRSNWLAAEQKVDVDVASGGNGIRAHLIVEDTPGGGATFVFSLRQALR